MNFSKYFKTGQKVMLRPIAPAEQGDRGEMLTVYFKDFSKGMFELELPYRTQQDEAYPFDEAIPLELLSEAFGVGIRTTALFRGSPSTQLIRVEPTAELTIFQRRIKDRADLNIGLRYTRGLGKLRSFRDQWRKNVQILAESKDLSRLGNSPRCAVNLSGSGIRFELKGPVEMAELFLLLLDVAPGEAPICTLAETVWTAPGNDPGLVSVGMRFVNIQEKDQKRIERLVQAANTLAPAST